MTLYNHDRQIVQSMFAFLLFINVYYQESSIEQNETEMKRR